MIQDGELTLSCCRKADILLCAHLGHSTPLDKVLKADVCHPAVGRNQSLVDANHRTRPGFIASVDFDD
jgi:hypothetical protein